MADKSVPQLTAKTSSTSGDLYHLVRSNVDYKIDFDDLQTSILGGTAGEITYKASLTITSAKILTLNGTPLTIVSATGAGTYIEAISASASMTYGTTPYATNTTLQIINDGADNAQLINASALIGTVTKNTKFYTNNSIPTAGQTQIITNTALQVNVLTGNPTAGDSDITVHVFYRIITL
jgi:hypothetical protein